MTQELTPNPNTRRYSEYAAQQSTEEPSLAPSPQKATTTAAWSQSTLTSMAPSASPQPPSASKLPAFILRSDEELEAEFKQLNKTNPIVKKDVAEIPEYSIGSRPENDRWNRYPNILANDDTRVILPNRDLNENDYINANHCLGGKVILTQGPTWLTEGDFFDMIWAQGCSAIAMLTDYQEGNKEKCNRYVGEKDKNRISGQYSNEATLVEEKSGIKISKMTLFKEEGVIKNEKTLNHYHVTGWNINTGAIEPKTIAELVKLILLETKPVIHCSGGVGRSGVVAAVLGAYQSGRTLFDEVTALRSERRGCIQNPEQYILAHQALKILLEEKSSGL